MQQDDRFISDNKGSIFKNNSRRRFNEPVIKNNQVVVGLPTKIKPRMATGSHTHKSNVFPLMEGDNIVGFVYECSCGEVAKVMFDFEQEVGRKAV